MNSSVMFRRHFTFIIVIIAAATTMTFVIATPKPTEANASISYTQAMLSGAAMYSIENQDKALLKSTLRAGFDVNKPFCLPENAGGEQNGNYALHLACALGNTEAVDVLLKSKADSLIRNQLGELAIHCADNPGCIELLKRKEQPKEFEALIEVLIQCKFPLGFLDFDADKRFMMAATHIPNNVAVRPLTQMKEATDSAGTKSRVDRDSGEKGGIITVKMKKHADGLGFDFEAHWDGGPLNGKDHFGKVVVWHGFWKAIITKSVES